jgi:hypothetical protein
MLRKGGQLMVGQPRMDMAAVATNGPIIQGRGVLSCTQIKAATKPTDKVVRILSADDFNGLRIREALMEMICACQLVYACLIKIGDTSFLESCTCITFHVARD